MKAPRKSKHITPKKKRASFMSPLGEKKPLRRSKRNAYKVLPETKSVTLATYKSPLQHLYDNDPEKSSAQPRTFKKEVEETNTEILDDVDKIKASESNKILNKILNKKIACEIVKEDFDDEFSNLTFDFLNCSPIKKEEEEEIDNGKYNEDSNNTSQPKKSKKWKKKSIHKLIRSGEKLNFSKKRKLKNKSILSKFNETPESSNVLDENVILIDDSDSDKSPIKPFLNEQNVKSNGICSNQELLKSEEVLKESLLNESTQSAKQNCVQSPPKYIECLKDPIKGASESVVHSVNKSSFSESMTNRQEAITNVIHGTNELNNLQPLENSEDVIIVDCNDSLQMEMEAYHNKFNQSIYSEPTCSDSVIILDPDDETPASITTDENETQSTRQEETAKTSEDCFVVWSSLPSTSKAKISLKSQPLFDSNSDILKQDKILIDTSPDMSNYRFLNNENNKPKKKFMKVSKANAKCGKHIPLKSMLDKTKDIASKTAKSAAEVASKVVSKSDNRCTEKTSCKRKSKNSEDLIFLLDKGDGKANATNLPRKGNLREIVIDGSNVGMAYTHNNTFSEKGIQVLIDYFTKKGHTVKVFIPQYRRSYSYPLLEKWYKEGIVVFTPSRKIGNKHFTPYDDRYILEYATACGGIVVSQDQFRDLYKEKPQYRDIIENRLLVPTFVGDYVMFPEDPLGRGGPILSNFLRH